MKNIIPICTITIKNKIYLKQEEYFMQENLKENANEMFVMIQEIDHLIV